MLTPTPEIVAQFFDEILSGYDQIDIRGQAEVVFSHPQNGYPDDQIDARKYLKLGQTYSVYDIVAEGWSTKVYLNDVFTESGSDRIAFNSCLFSTPKDNRYRLITAMKSQYLELLKSYDGNWY
jgi:hypothetical protein